MSWFRCANYGMKSYIFAQQRAQRTADDIDMKFVGKIRWCKSEIVVDSPKDISVPTSKSLLEIPAVIVAAINLKTTINPKQNINEIVSASVIWCSKAKIDGPMVASECKRRGTLTHFTVVHKAEGGIFPMGLTKEISNRNSKAGTNVLALESSECALLNRLMIEMHKLDCDVLVGHNISGFDLDVLLHRAQPSLFHQA